MAVNQLEPSDLTSYDTPLEIGAVQGTRGEGASADAAVVSLHRVTYSRRAMDRAEYQRLRNFLGLVPVPLIVSLAATGCFLDHGSPPDDGWEWVVPPPAASEPGAPDDCAATDVVEAGMHVVGMGTEHVDLAHWVTLTQATWVGRFEVSAGCYARCVRAGRCRASDVLDCDGECASILSVDLAPGYWREPEAALLPIVNVEREGMARYCTWLGGRLPTSAEWEKVARGPNGRLQPWLADPDNPLVQPRELTEALWRAWPDPRAHAPRQSLGPSVAVVAIDAHPDGRGPFGHYNILGNATEWVSDLTGEIYGDRTDTTDPTGPSPGPHHSPMSRGQGPSSAERIEAAPDHYTDWVGGRCAFASAPAPRYMWEDGPR